MHIGCSSLSMKLSLNLVQLYLVWLTVVSLQPWIFSHGFPHPWLLTQTRRTSN